MQIDCFIKTTCIRKVFLTFYSDIHNYILLIRLEKQKNINITVQKASYFPNFIYLFTSLFVVNTYKCLKY